MTKINEHGDTPKGVTPYRHSSETPPAWRSAFYPSLRGTTRARISTSAGIVGNLQSRASFTAQTAKGQTTPTCVARGPSAATQHKDRDMTTVVIHRLHAAITANAATRDMVEPHAAALESCAASMEAAGVGTAPKVGHAAALRHMAASMRAEAAMGKVPHIWRDQVYASADDKMLRVRR